MRIRLGLVLRLAVALVNVQAAAQDRIPEFPFQFREGMIWLKVRVPESTEPLNFLLDSGAGVSVVNLRTAQKLNLKPGRQVSVQGVDAATTGYWPEHLSATVGEVSLPKDFLAVDLGELSQACRCAVDGLIGADFFRNRIVKIDFSSRMIRLLPASERIESQELLPLRVRRGELSVSICVNGRARQWVRLDTGCASALHWVTSNVRANESARRVAIGLTALSLPVAQTIVKLGTAEFDAVPTELHREAIFAGEAGLLGNGLLSRFKTVTIDTKARRVLLEAKCTPTDR